MVDSCPIPVKKQKTDSSLENSDNEDFNLSRTFDEDYQILMNEEMLKICKQPSILIENFEMDELLPDFFNYCDELLECIEDATTKTRFKCLCRCDLYLDKYEKICCIKRLFESPRFTNINPLANMTISNQPHLANEVQKKLDELQNVWKLKYLIFDIDLSLIVKDIKTDIDDLQFWLKKIKEKLGVQIDKQRMEYDESIEDILTDFKIHNDISNSIIKTMEKVIQLDSSMEYGETLSNCKITLRELILQIYGQWLKAMELKYKLELTTNIVINKKDFSVSLVGQESGFESEISPMNPIRGFPTNNLCLMKYISSSGECIADNNTTDFPIDSDSTELHLDFTNNRSISSSSSLVEIMLDLPRHSQIIKDDVNVRKKQKRLKKRRQMASKSTEACSENLSIEEKLIRNAFYKQSSSLKRRISETSIAQEVDRTDVTASRISVDLAAAAEKIVMRNDFNRRKNSFSESPKESEIDDPYGIVVNSANDLNVKEVWDNYQASLYSNDDGDSQILEVDKIKNWEQEPETDNQDYESCYNDKTLQFLTSGYETSMESDMHFCHKDLLNILQFSASQQLDVSQQIDIISKQLNSLDTGAIDKINSTINEQLSISNTHVKLLNQILNGDPCGGNRNETLTKEIHFLQNNWENLIKRFILIQSKQERVNSYMLESIIRNINEIDSKMSDIEIGNDLNDMKSAIDVLKELKMELFNVNAKIVKIHSDGRYVLEEDIKNITNRIADMTDKICRILNPLNKDYEIMKTCTEKLMECQNTRKKIEIELNCFTLTNKATDWKTLSNNMLMTLENSKEILNTCMVDLSDMSREKCYENMKFNFDQELHLIDELNLQLRLALPVIDNLRSKMNPFSVSKSIPKASSSSVSGLFNRLPVQVAIVVIIAICGWWYKQQSSYSCQDSYWLKLLRKYTNNMEPH